MHPSGRGAGAAYRAAVDYVTGLVRAEPSTPAERERVGLAPMRALLDALGHPERDLACIHVAGSKGKGSTVLLAERVLGAAGLLTGAYTSPHLVEWTERIRVAGSPVERETFAAAVLAVRDAHAAAAGAPAPSFFDVLTAAALLAFSRAGVDAVLLETGLGGRLDATNAVAAPRATCITTIELEHVDRLGGTLAAIAAEKAGIVKAGVPLVTGALHPEAEAVVAARASALGVARWSLRDACSVTADARGGWRVALDTPAGALAFRVAHPSAVMAEDAALALACVACSGLVAQGAALASAARALEDARVPGRLDVVGTAPLRVVDGAHTAASVARLVEMLEALGAPPLDLVVSVTRGKDPRALLAPLLERAARVYLTCAEPSRSLGAGELARAIEGLPGAGRARVLDDPGDALAAALAAVPDDGALCATGSIYLAGTALAVLEARPRT